MSRDLEEAWHFFMQALRFAKMGGVSMPLGNMINSWSQAGFGHWTHIVPDRALPMLAESMERSKTIFGIEAGLPDHFPHFIFKPPGGSSLGSHSDGFSPVELIGALERHESEGLSNLEWAKTHGVQRLIHLEGGASMCDGATSAPMPMTPSRLLLCLRELKDKWPDRL